MDIRINFNRAVIMKKISILLIITASMFAFAAQAMKHRGTDNNAKKKITKYRQSLEKRRRLIGVVGKYPMHRTVIIRKAELEQKHGNQTMSHALFKIANTRTLPLPVKVQPRKMKVLFENTEVADTQIRENSIIFLQDLIITNQELRKLDDLKMHLHALKQLAPIFIEELRSSGGSDVIPYIKNELNHIEDKLNQQ